jgi:PAS domain S-box-containing protein
MAAIESRAWPVRQTWAAFTALHRVGDAIITTDGQGRVELLNPAAEALTGWKDKEAQGRPLDEVFRLVDKETRENLENPVTRIVRDGPIANQPDHAILLDREGTARPIAYSGAPVRDDHGAIAGVVVTFRDQTGEPAAQRTLSDSQSMLGSVLDTIPVRVFWKDLEGKFLGCNASFARDSGFSTPNELIGKDDFQMGWKREAELYRADDRQVIETGVPKIGFEEPQTTPDGDCRWLRTSKIPLRDDEGHTIGVLGTYEDITPRKEADIALQESEARFRSLFENNHTVMFVIDPESGAIVDANPAAAAYYGWSRDELITKKIAAINTLTAEQIQAEMQVARDAHRGNFNFKHRRADRSIREVEVFSSPVRVAGRTLLYSLVFDVTDRRRADARIRRLNRTLAVLSDINQAIVRERDLLALYRETCRIAVEKGGFRMAWIGLLDSVAARVDPVAHAGEAGDYIEKLDIDLSDSRRVAGQTGTALRQGEHAICNDIENDSFMRPWRGAALHLGYRSCGAFPLKIAGRTIGVVSLYSGEPGFFDEEELLLLDELAMDLSFAIEHAEAESGRRAAEERARHLAAFPELNPNPVLEFAADGMLAYANPAAHALAAAAGVAELPALFPPDTRQIVLECLAQDQPRLRLETQNGPRTVSWSFYPIASQKTVHCYAGDITERLQLEESFRQAQKMEAIGQLAGGVAHDFNNLLTVILGYCGLLLASADAEITESAKEIQAAAVRAANLTRQLLTFSRRQPMRMMPLDLDDAVLSVGRMLQRLIGEDIMLRTRLLPGGAWIEGDSGMIEQVLLNLAVNARDAMPGGGELWIELDDVTLDEAAARQHPEGRPGSFICLSLRDTGRGIAANHLPHIFEPFFTTKEVGKGTGLGLATVHGIVEQHNGWIEVESHSGEGTTFRVHLPRLPQGADRPGGAPKASRVLGGNEAILVVEDEPAVRALASKILGAQGYRVQAASSGVAALELWRRQAGAFDLLLTDLIMPGGVSGAQLAAQLRSEQPGLRVIYMSGYRGDTAPGGVGANFLQKPFDPAHLARAVRACLDDGP